MNEPTDAMLDDPLYRRDVMEEEARTWREESTSDDDEIDDIENASPRPWKLLEGKVPTFPRYISVVHGNNLGIADMVGAGSRNPKVMLEVRANAALILAAVNAWDDPDLLKARLDELNENN